MNLTDQHRREQLPIILQSIEQALKKYDLWLTEDSAKWPTEKDLASVQPFCVDTMAFEVWLQCVLIPRFNAMLGANLPLPQSCDIYPMAQECSKQQNFPQLLVAIKALDQLLTVSKG